MQKTEREIPYDFSDNVTDRIFDVNSIFFDIETTGFSSVKNNVYLIGCAVRRRDKIVVTQYFAEEISDEASVIESFINQLNDYTNIISFNGGGFDIPFLKGRTKILNISHHFDDYTMTDLYKASSKLKSVLHLPDCRQKTIEHFLGIERDDMYDGGQLIQVYHEYLRDRSSEKLSLLLLHNYDDVVGMTDLLSIMSYEILCQGAFEVASLTSGTYRAYDGSIGMEINIVLTNNVRIPVSLSASNDDVHIRIGHDTTKINIKLFEGELYYYTPGSKKDGAAISEYAIFLPQYDNLFEPSYAQKRSAAKKYFMLSEQFAADTAMQHKYASHLLKTVIFSRKRTTSRARSQSPCNP